jgi:hypothetical protein
MRVLDSGLMEKMKMSVGWWRKDGAVAAFNSGILVLIVYL